MTTKDQWPHVVARYENGELVESTKFNNRHAANTHVTLGDDSGTSRIFRQNQVTAGGTPFDPAETEVPILPQDSSSFDFMMAGSSIRSGSFVTIHVNQYAKQNVLEFPGVWEMGSLGAIWFTDLWNGDRDGLLVDADPSWGRFIDDLLVLVYSRVPKANIVLFYWP